MKRWQVLLIAIFGFALAQEPLPFQEWVLPKVEVNKILYKWLEPLLPVQEKTYSMWYAEIPEGINFSMQFSSIPDGVEYFIYPPVPTFDWPKLEDTQLLPEPKKP